LSQPIKAKKHLGQHFLHDLNIAQKIVKSLPETTDAVIEIGPGTGVLTQYLIEKENFRAFDIDQESIDFLKEKYPQFAHKISFQDFLEADLNALVAEKHYNIIGNFPYNISTQIVFRTLEYRNQIPEFAGMFQKEVAERICSKKGSKVYGILSVLAQAFYDVEYLFTVDETVFDPPPKVKSGVMRMRRKENYSLPCSEKLLFTVVKTAFQQRRKTMRNSLKSLNLSDNLREDTIFDLRPEQLSVEQFIELTQKIEANAV
jgi:16S rRNA (adenine1518-N6/adenine1519-N6)-dimethyltransferase